MSPDRNVSSPALSQTPNCTNDMKDLTLNLNNNESNTNNNPLNPNDDNTALAATSSLPNANNNSLTAVPSSYSPSVFNSAYGCTNFDTKNSLSLSPSQLNPHHSAHYGGYPVAGHNHMDFGNGGYTGGFYHSPAMASVLGKSPFTAPTSASPNGDKNKNSKRSNTG